MQKNIRKIKTIQKKYEDARFKTLGNDSKKNKDRLETFRRKKELYPYQAFKWIAYREGYLNETDENVLTTMTYIINTMNLFDIKYPTTENLKKENVIKIVDRMVDKYITFYRKRDVIVSTIYKSKLENMNENLKEVKL